MWHDINCRDRILSWRSWRKSLNDLPWSECLAEVARVWNLAPVVNHYLVPDMPKEWPAPWQLINDNMYCDLGIALGMFYTLILTDHPEAQNCSIAIYKDNNGWINLCLDGSGLSMLNWVSGKVVNISTLPEEAKLIFTYSKVDLAHKLD